MAPTRSDADEDWFCYQSIVSSRHYDKIWEFKTRRVWKKEDLSPLLTGRGAASYGIPGRGGDGRAGAAGIPGRLTTTTGGAAGTTMAATLGTNPGGDGTAGALGTIPAATGLVVAGGIIR